jgi:ATP-binding cassette, subfamily B (MDR/TAP), member 1
MMNRFLMQSEEEKEVKVKFTRLLGLARPEWLYVAAGISASAVLGCVMPLFAVFLSSLIVSLAPSEPRWTANKFGIGFIALGVGMLIMATIQGFTFAVVGSNIAVRVRKMFFRAIVYMEVGWFDKDTNTSGALSSRLSSDAPAVRGAVSDVMGVTVQNVVTLVAGYIIAFINGWRMTLLITAVLPLVGFSSWMQMKFFTGAAALLRLVFEWNTRALCMFQLGGTKAGCVIPCRWTKAGNMIAVLCMCETPSCNGLIGLSEGIT